MKMNEYIAISVDANAAQYHEHCKRVAEAQYGNVLDKLPEDGKVVAHKTISTWGLPTWAYTFYVKAPQQ